MRSRLFEAETSELGIGLLNFICFKFTTDLPISHLGAVSVIGLLISRLKQPLFQKLLEKTMQRKYRSSHYNIK